MDPDTDVQVLNAARAEMLEQLAGGMPYAMVAKHWQLSKGTVWRIVVKGHEPKDPSIREKLGLTPCFMPSTQYHNVRRCVECGNTFIPNTAKRVRCFECTPFRKRT
jgi:hypothetical protein